MQQLNNFHFTFSTMTNLVLKSSELDEFDAAQRSRTYVEEGRGIDIDRDDAVRAWLEQREQDMRQED